MEHGESSAPQFIRDFSREQSPETYKQTVQAIKDKRQEFHQQRKARTEKQNNLQETTTEQEQTLNETLTGLNNLRDRVDELSTSKFKKLISYFRLRKIRADIEVGERSYEELKQQQELTTSQLQETAEQLKTPPELQEAKDILSSFYKDQKEKWAKSSYSKEEIKTLFTEEHLSSLSLEDYTLLLRKFPSEMVAHVTRQGIRDHIGLINHSAGAGEFSNAFIKIIEDGHMRPPLGIHLIEAEREKSLADFLKLNESATKDIALAKLYSFIRPENQGASGSYVDAMAIHFATEEVADHFYGSEKGNEIFIIYPSALIASQYFFSGQLNKVGGGYWNDQWIWANEEHGIDINAGIIFIPASTNVDQKTGSRYQLDENNNPIVNSEYNSLFRKVVDSPNFQEFAKKIMEITSHHYIDISSVKELDPFRQILEQTFNIKDKRLQNAILSYQNLENILFCQRQQDGNTNYNIDSEIGEALLKEGILFLESQNTISSKNYWENYFNQHPQQRPSKIVYYEAQDPTRALQIWKKENGLIKTTTDENIGFKEQNVQRNDAHATGGIDRFRALAEKIIEDYYN